MAARAQQGVRRIGVLMPGDENNPEGKPRYSVFMQIPAHRGQSFRCIADSVPVIADSCR
jgi:hypothetical protein